MEFCITFPGRTPLIVVASTLLHRRLSDPALHRLAGGRNGRHRKQKPRRKINVRTV